MKLSSNSILIKGVRLYGDGDQVDVLVTDGQIAEIGTGLVADLDHADDETDYAEPDFEPSPELCTVAWTVYSLPAAPTPEHFDLGDAEFALRSAVRSAADALGRLRAEGYGMGIDDPRGLIDQLVESTLAHRAPEHAPERAIRVLALLDPTVSKTVGLPDARSCSMVSKRASPSVKLSR